jgi:hypothetical protein
MKIKTTFLALSLTVISATAMSQNRGDNEILVHSTTLKIAMNTLMDAGYSIDKYDTTLGTVSTVTRQAQHTSLTVIWRVRIKDSTAIITGDWMSMVSMSLGGAKSEPNYHPIDYRTNSMNETHKIFLGMVELAKKMGSPVVFTKVEP